MNGGHEQRNRTILCLLTNPASACNIRMVGFKIKDTESIIGENWPGNTARFYTRSNLEMSGGSMNGLPCPIKTSEASFIAYRSVLKGLLQFVTETLNMISSLLHLI
ncbi:hypothetical protein TNCV_2412091 [Trichonephila clavipes]|nr:hypothetical protein TNCV_2412091 [Trichonephila clavipes]